MTVMQKKCVLSLCNVPSVYVDFSVLFKGLYETVEENPAFVFQTQSAADASSQCSGDLAKTSKLSRVVSSSRALLKCCTSKKTPV